MEVASRRGNARTRRRQQYSIVRECNQRRCATRTDGRPAGPARRGPLPPHPVIQEVGSGRPLFVLCALVLVIALACGQLWLALGFKRRGSSRRPERERERGAS